MDTPFGVVLRASALFIVALVFGLTLSQYRQHQIDSTFQRNVTSLTDGTRGEAQREFADDRVDSSTAETSQSERTFRTSFDCIKALPGSQDAMICHDAALAAKDVELHKLVKEILAMPAVDQQQFADALRHVRRVKVDCRTDVPCLTLWYDATINALQKKIDGQ